LLGAGAAVAVTRPALVLARPPVKDVAVSLAGVVRLSSNENPYGPSAKAIQAMTDSFGLACRYPDALVDLLAESVAKVNGVPSDQILIGDGSGEILKLCADVFTGPITKKGGGVLVVADPTFEAIVYHAELAGAEVVKVPLTSTFAHDLEKMRAAVKGGLVYICNPNNPTASITPKNAVRDFIAAVPKDTMILVDEAYFHYAESPDYETMIPLVQKHPNLLVARTFSKIYGMAGLRCGYCVGQTFAIEKLRERQSWDSVNVMAVAAAKASLEDPEQVTNGRKMNASARAFTLAELEKLGYVSIPSQANFIMFDVKRPVVPLIASLKSRKVEVGRLFRPMPNHMRLTIGKKAEMEQFLAAFQQVTAGSPA
jgi:histidinol-phosphate aminotransferase